MASLGESSTGASYQLGSAEQQAEEVTLLHTRIAELQSQLQQEQHRAELLETELQQLRTARSSSRSGGGGSLQQQLQHDAGAACSADTCAALCVRGDTAAHVLLPSSSSDQQQQLQQQHTELMQQVLLPMQQLHLQQQHLQQQHLLQQQQQQLNGSSSAATSCSSLSCQSQQQQQQQDHHHHQQSGPLADSSSSSSSASGGHMVGGHTSSHTCGHTRDVVLTRAEHELLLLKVRAMDAVKEGITIADCSRPDMPLIYVNMGFCRITGYGLEEVLNKNCRFLQGPCSNQEGGQQLRAAINAGRSCVVQLMNYRKNGDPFVNLLSITPIHDALGRLTHYVGIQSDITELVNHKKAELAARHAALQAAAATEAKSQFLARMSHEIRTPLNGMIAVGQLLAETSLSPAQWDLVNTIRCSGETLLTLITDILDFSRIEANKLVLSAAVFSLQTVVEAAMEIAGLRAAQKRLQMAYHISSGIPRLLCGDAQRLQQVLLNVLNNAVKFTEAGEILLEIWPEPLQQVSPVTPALIGTHHHHQQQQEQHVPEAADGGLPSTSSSNAAQQGAAGSSSGSGSGVAPGGPDEWPTRLIRFSVKDTGIGISEGDLGKLFKSFSQVDASVTRSYGGSGLGLVISKRLAEAMGGRMWAESAGPGSGSTFSWSIAVKIPPQGRNSTVNTAAKGRRSSVLLSAPTSKKEQQQQRWQQYGIADGGGSGGFGLNLGGSGLAGFSAGGPCQDSDETCSVVSSDAGTVASERETLSILSLPASHKHRAAASSSTTTTTAAIASQGSANLAAAAAAAAAAVSTPSAAAAAAGVFAGLSTSPALHSPLSLLLPQQQQQGVAGGGSSSSSFGLPFGSGGSSSSAAVTAAPGEAAMPLLRGKRVLLVEPCRVVRCVLALALRSWGCLVCAVSSEAAAMQRLVMNGTLHLAPGSAAALLAEAVAVEVGPAAAAAAVGGTAAAAGGSSCAAAAACSSAAGDSSSSSSGGGGVLQLDHALGMDERKFCCSGPYDCVLLDMHHTRLLSALTLCEDREAARLVFMGWPGQGEVEAAAPQFDMELELLVTPPVAAAANSQLDSSSLAGAAAVPGPPGAQGEAGAAVAGLAGHLPRSVSNAAAAAPAVLQLEEHWRPGNRQLGYVTVTRPLRQGRLKLALEEVLVMSLEPDNPDSPCSSMGGGSDGYPAAADLEQPPNLQQQLDWQQQGVAIVPGAQHDHHQRQQQRLSMQEQQKPQQQVGELMALSPGSRPAASAAAADRQQQQQQQRGSGLTSHQLCDELAGTLSDSYSDSTDAAEAAAAAAAAAVGALPSTGLLSQQQQQAFAGAAAAVSTPLACVTEEALCDLLSDGSITSSLEAAGPLALPPAAAAASSSGQHQRVRRLPLLKPAAAVKHQGCGLEAVAGGSKAAALRVLLAEDNAINMKVATGILSRIGVQQVAQAVNGQEALAAVEARGGADAFDVLLIDLHMPLMGGMEVVSCFKQRYPHSKTVLVAVTADAFEDTRDRCLEAGFDAWLAKPFRVEDLVKVIADSQARLQQSSGSSSSAAAAGSSSSSGGGVLPAASVHH